MNKWYEVVAGPLAVDCPAPADFPSAEAAATACTVAQNACLVVAPRPPLYTSLD